MNNSATLPWDDDNSISFTSGEDLHARATSLAHAAMEVAASTPFNPADTDYARAQAEYDRRLTEIRNENARNHVAANNARAAEAAARKAERQAAHEARNAAARQRKLDKAA